MATSFQSIGLMGHAKGQIRCGSEFQYKRRWNHQEHLANNWTKDQVPTSNIAKVKKYPKWSFYGVSHNKVIGAQPHFE